MRKFGDALTYKELLWSVRYVRLSPRRLELRGIVISNYMRSYGFPQRPQVGRLSLRFAPLVCLLSLTYFYSYQHLARLYVLEPPKHISVTDIYLCYKDTNLRFTT